MSALKGAAARLGGLREGRKSVIFVSEGFTTILPPQLNEQVAAMPGMAGRAAPAAAQNTDRAEWSATVNMVSDMSLIFTEMNRNNTSIYAVDPKGLAPFEYDINQGVGLQVDRKHLEMGLDTLRALADNTDGRAIVNRNDIGKAMQQIIRDASGYYLIGYNSSQAPTDGKFHKIDVEVTRKGVDVRARKGYWAYTAEDAARVEAPRAEAPPAVTRGARHPRRSTAWTAGALLDRDRARRERQVESHVCLGTDCPPARRTSSGRGGRLPRHADGARA